VGLKQLLATVLWCYVSGDLWSYNRESDSFVVSPIPDVSVHKLDIAIHRCIIVASDGIWNMVSAAEAVEFVEHWLRRRHKLPALVSTGTSFLVMSISHEYRLSVYDHKLVCCQNGPDIRLVIKRSSQLSLAIPLCVDKMSISESRGVNRHTMWRSGSVSVVWQCKLESSWWLRKWTAALLLCLLQSNVVGFIRFCKKRPN